MRNDSDLDHGLAIAEDWCRREGILSPRFKVDPEVLIRAARIVTGIYWINTFLASYLDAADDEVKDPTRLEEIGEVCRAKVGAAKGDYYMTLRVAILGKQDTPPLFPSMALLADTWGRKQVVERLERAIEKLRGVAMDTNATL